MMTNCQVTVWPMEEAKSGQRCGVIKVCNPDPDHEQTHCHQYYVLLPQESHAFPLKDCLACILNTWDDALLDPALLVGASWSRSG